MNNSPVKVNIYNMEIMKESYFLSLAKFWWSCANERICSVNKIFLNLQNMCKNIKIGCLVGLWW